MLIVRLDVKDGGRPVEVTVAYDLDVCRIRKYFREAEAAFERCEELDEQKRVEKCSQST